MRWSGRLRRAEAVGVEVVHRVVTGGDSAVPVRDYVPVRGRRARPLLWVHGGAFHSGSLDMAESHAVALAVARSGRTVRTVDYRLVPRGPVLGNRPLRPSANRYPAAADDVHAATLDLMRAAEGPVVLGGASAGACLAVTASLRLRDGGELPAALVLAYGTFHAELPALPESVRARRRGALGWLQFTPAMVRGMNVNYVGSEALLTDRLAFPGGGQLEGLPPSLLVDADRDTLRASGETFAEELRSAGVTTEHVVVPGTFHGFFSAPWSRGYRRGLAHVLRWLDLHE
ncbi:alpha/beta hydrolase fold domain-containing protein [Salinifilum aidingensis]